MRFAKNTIADIGAQSATFELGEQMDVERSWRDGKLDRSGGVGSFFATRFKSISGAAMRKSSCLVVLGGFLVLLGTSQNASATNYFNWGVESLRLNYGVNGPGQYDVSPLGTTTIDCTASHSGSCSMKIVVKGNDSGNQALGVDAIGHNPPYSSKVVGAPKLYYRWWMRIMPGFSWGSGTAKTKSMRTGGPNDERGWTGYLLRDAFDIAECDPGCRTNTGGSAADDTSLIIPYNFTSKADGVWHEYIISLKPNTSGSCTAGVNCDAQFQAWVDGVSVGQYNNFKLVDSSNNITWVDYWGGWMVRPYFQLNGTSSDGGTIYLDDYSVDDVYNSLIGGAQTALSPPTNLRVQ